MLLGPHFTLAFSLPECLGGSCFLVNISIWKFLILYGDHEVTAERGERGRILEKCRNELG